MHTSAKGAKYPAYDCDNLNSNPKIIEKRTVENLYSAYDPDLSQHLIFSSFGQP